MPKFRKRPIEISAIRWEGGDYDCLNSFCGQNWARADARDHAWEGAPDKEEVIVWNTADRQWLEIPTGFWIIRGIEGELYPCDPNIFKQTYAPVEP